MRYVRYSDVQDMRRRASDVSAQWIRPFNANETLVKWDYDGAILGSWGMEWSSRRISLRKTGEREV